MKKESFHVFLLCLILLFIVLFGVFAKYKKEILINSSTIVAKPILKLNSSNVKNIKGLNEDVFYYEFSVQNFDEKNEISDVEFKYLIEFLMSQKDAPVELNLYRENGEKIELKDNKTVKFETIPIGKKEEKYKVEIKYNKNSNTIMNDNLIVKVNIKTV